MLKKKASVYLSLLILLGLSSLTNSQTLISQFDFNSNLNDNLAVSTCSLYNNSVTSYSSGVLSFTASGAPGGGVIIDVPSSAFTFTNYSIELEFSLGTLGGYRKVIDFKNMGSDDGLYLLNNILNFYPVASGTFTFAPNTLYTIFLTRNGSSQACQASVFAGSTLLSQFTFTDASSMATFVGEDIIFTHIHEDQVALAFFTTSSLIIEGIAAIRIYARVFLGPHVKTNHESAFKSS